MAQGGGGGGEGQDKDTYTLLWILATIFVVGGLVWYFAGDYLKIAFIAIKKYEALAISFFIDNPTLHKAISWLEIATPGDLTWPATNQLSNYLGGYLMYPIAFMLIVLAIIMLRGHAMMRFTKTYNMDTLVQQEKENWPQIAPVADLNLIEEDLNKGAWAIAMNPMQFARHYQLLKVEIVSDRKAMWRQEGVAKATVIREKALQVFASQLGPLWTGVDNLPPHTKALYAAFLARTEHDTDACRGYLAKLAKSAAKGTIDYSDTQDLLKKFGKSKAAQRCHQKHAYILTVMASMLVLARVDGVLASADFLWVKPLDRKLWYVLNCVGRQVGVAEVAGIFAHWLAEKEMGRALTVPMVDEAANGLEKALSMMIYTPAEDEVVPKAEATTD